METTLHHQLKEKFREPGSEIEVKIGRYRIDVVNHGRLVEIQRSGLAAIRDKVAALVDDYEVDVVKPLILRKRLIKLDSKEGVVIGKRWSPHRGSMLDVFDELLYFTRVFPHPNLRLITPLIEIEEYRFPGHGRRRRRRKGDFEVKDQYLTEVRGMEIFQTAADLHRLLPADLPTTFDSASLAQGLGVQRWVGQQIAYVLRHTGSATLVGKQGNANQFKLTKPKSQRNGQPTKNNVEGTKTASEPSADVVAPSKRGGRKSVA
ncbi:MAG: hypothetical protein MK106_00520 [Mariniblastus sp.]|nr:hypothetical protein [Mariniblastus sp.]